MKLFWSRHKPSVLETCPPEICQQIFQLACLDGGFTGRSLSLVSRYIHSSAASVRYQSISVEGLDQILALTSILKVKEIQHRRVHHLFLSHCPPPRPYPPRTRSLVPEFFATVIRSDRLSRWARQFTSSVLCKSIPLGPRRVRTTGSREGMSKCFV
ncbi:hypothetical protein JAAARDRAFT_449788 [Jaapia argillacea MUCL 33604]|uniref:Uncharacterized protein n=1 Tax=Jaapia argillacea MUCL 33604 TaxID=933084 RepID=A0A067Q7F9_9AGAM|nr:hypothetical protein JAAARDRAFT_449788 [Jaapia argillacea MUCL 33604]